MKVPSEAQAKLIADMWVKDSAIGVPRIEQLGYATPTSLALVKNGWVTKTSLSETRGAHDYVYDLHKLNGTALDALAEYLFRRPAVK